MPEKNRIMIDFPKDYTRVWDLPVPVVEDKENKVIKGYITGTIDEPVNYNELCYLLLEADSDTEVQLHINTPGGIIDSAFMLINAIKMSKAKVVAHLAGTVASAGTLISMACDEIVAADHLSFMIHNYSGGMQGKGHEMRARQDFMDTQLNTAFKDFYAGFLEESEMDKVIEGTDMWMGTEEVLKRWVGRVNYRDGE